MNNADLDMEEQTKLAMQKYGQAKKKPLIAKDAKHFDSADYAKNKQLEEAKAQ